MDSSDGAGVNLGMTALFQCFLCEALFWAAALMFAAGHHLVWPHLTTQQHNGAHK